MRLSRISRLRFVFSWCSLCLCGEFFFALAGEETANPLFEQLRKDGVVLGEDKGVPLPVPLMADGLDATGQREVLQKVAGKRFSVRDFTAKSGTAPHVYAVRKIAASQEATPALAIDVSFVAHGSLDTVANRNFLENLHKKSKDRRIHLLTAKELEQRKLKIESHKQREERYSHGAFTILDRVELRAALHTVVTRRDDSLLAATRFDPRFANDSDFPNRWRKITFDEEGQRQLGPPHPYTGAGGYLKVTRLHEPTGALFLEYHLIYSEPKEWFNGADPLTPKLPAIIQSEVRSFRRELRLGTKTP
jgi:hypothetical protein